MKLVKKPLPEKREEPTYKQWEPIVQQFLDSGWESAVLQDVTRTTKVEASLRSCVNTLFRGKVGVCCRKQEIYLVRL